MTPEAQEMSILHLQCLLGLVVSFQKAWGLNLMVDLDPEFDLGSYKGLIVGLVVPGFPLTAIKQYNAMNSHLTTMQ